MLKKPTYEELEHKVKELEETAVEYKQAEEALQESEARFRSFFENAAVAVAIVDQDGHVVEANETDCQFLGYSHSELIGMHFAQFTHADDLMQDGDLYRSLVEGERQDYNVEKRYIRKDGEVVWGHLCVSLIPESQGRSKYTMVVCEDITERKRAEEALQKAHDELERRVAARTADLIIANERLKQQVEERERAEEEKRKLQSQLQQAKKMEAIGTLARGVAHDFNNLLMGIQGNVSLMKLDVDSRRAYERLKSIEKQVESGATLTSQLLGYARKGTYQLESLNLSQLVKDVSETFGRTKKEITIHRELSDDLFAVEADSGQMEQVLLNLFVNAADAMPRGGDLFLSTVNVTHEAISSKLYNPKHGDYVLLRVTDTGIGMDKDTMDRVFDPFFTTKEIGHGTGLGLASAYGIIKAHAGYIDVQSEKGVGTSFSIYLPASEKRVQKALKPAEEVVEGTETVLLVDDEAVILEVGKDLLEAMGYRVLTARDGKEAVDVYKDNKDKIDLVIVDMIMPRMGGGEAYDLMREINPEIIVLLSTGYSIDGEATEILKRGCNGFIQKPFKMKRLSQAIREVLGTD